MTGQQQEVTVHQNDWVPEPSAEAAPRKAFLTRARAAVNTSLRKMGKFGKRLARGSLEPVGSVIYICRGRLPLTVGYREYRNRYLRKIIANDELLMLFKTCRELPQASALAWTSA